MSMIRTVSYKASIQADGSIYNESIEYGVEMDSMPLAQSQLDDAGARVDQLRQAILAKRREWEGLPAASVPAASPKSARAPASADQAKPAEKEAAIPSEPGKVQEDDALLIRCAKCGSVVEQRTSRKGVDYSYCPQCKDIRSPDGTFFSPPKGARA